MSNFVTTCGKAASILALASCAQDSRLSTQPMSRGEQTPNREGPPQLRALQPDVSSVAHTHHETGLSILSSDISSNTTLRIGRTYLIDGEVHVLRGVRLTIEDGVTVLIRNGYRARRTLDTSALIFDSGSQLNAHTVTFGSADESGSKVDAALNGGVFFCGSYRSGIKDGVSSHRNASLSCFRAYRIVADHIGRPDPALGDGNDNDRDDIDAISLIGVGGREWRVRTVETRCSGDDGFDAYNSSIALDTLSVTNPTEDGVNLTSSTLTIRKNCTIDMTPTESADRELFDFEIDYGRSRINLAKESFVRVRGVWGNEADDVRLTSRDMPRPPQLGSSNAHYEFDGVLKKSRARISSRSTD